MRARASASETARPMARVLREQAATAKLPELLRSLRRQENELQALRDRIAALDRRLAEWRWCNFPRHESTN